MQRVVSWLVVLFVIPAFLPRNIISGKHIYTHAFALSLFLSLTHSPTLHKYVKKIHLVGATVWWFMQTTFSETINFFFFFKEELLCIPTFLIIKGMQWNSTKRETTAIYLQYCMSLLQQLLNCDNDCSCVYVCMCVVGVCMYSAVVCMLCCVCVMCVGVVVRMCYTLLWTYLYVCMSVCACVIVCVTVYVCAFCKYLVNIPRHVYI